ncbi:MAG: RluA family pseudouridine synthase [Bacillota bacterium]
MDKKVFRVGEEEEGLRLDLFLVGAAREISRSAVQKLCREGFVLVDGKEQQKTGLRLKEGQKVELTLPPPPDAKAEPEKIPLDIVYEDRDLLVLNKSRGMVVHPAAGHQRGTLVNALLAHCSVLPPAWEKSRPGIVHRLDKDTSGLLVVAKSEKAFRSLAQQLKDRKVKREYRAVVHGVPPQVQGTINASLGRDPRNRKKFAVVREGTGRRAVTHYRLLAKNGPFSVLSLHLETGRTHQIRVHLAYLGCPVVGDPLYGPQRSPYRQTGQLLHARKLGFLHPRNGEYLEFIVEPGEEFHPFLPGGYGENEGL